MPLIDLANPTRFLNIASRVLPWLAGATAIAFAVGIYLSSFAPDDYQQGATVKIMFIHVPAAMLGMIGWGVMSMAALLTLVGAINIPIIKFSVNWWNTLHQDASIVRLDGPAIHPAILTPLLVMMLAFTLLFFTLHLAAMRNEIMRRRIRTLMMMQA